jgi:Putative beta-lactamase-inhibitor-like, PepSY-like
MMRVLRVLVPVAAYGLLALPADGRADEEKIPLERVPAAVMKAVKDKFPGATIREAEKEEEDGQTLYELELIYEGHKYEVTVKADGTITEIEKQIKPADLPKAVSRALKAKYPRAKIVKAAEVTKGAKKTFEVIVETADEKTLEVVLDHSGNILEEEENEGEDKD